MICAGVLGRSVVSLHHGGDLMLKRYLVDLRELTPEERETVRERLDGMAFMVCDRYSGSHGLVALEVFWDRSEDFFSSPVFPSSCHCIEI